MSHKNNIISIALAAFTTISSASDNRQQIVAISQEIQSLQEQLNSAHQKIQKICECTITKNADNKIDVSKIHQTANGRR